MLGLVCAASRPINLKGGQAISKKSLGPAREVLSAHLPRKLCEAALDGSGLGVHQVSESVVAVASAGVPMFVLYNPKGELACADVLNPTRARRFQLTVFPTLHLVAQHPTALPALETNTQVAGILAARAQPLMAPGVSAVRRHAKTPLEVGTVVVLSFRADAGAVLTPYAIATLVAPIVDRVPTSGQLADVRHIVGDGLWGCDASRPSTMSAYLAEAGAAAAAAAAAATKTPDVVTTAGVDGSDGRKVQASRAAGGEEDGGCISPVEDLATELDGGGHAQSLQAEESDAAMLRSADDVVLVGSSEGRESRVSEGDGESVAGGDSEGDGALRAPHDSSWVVVDGEFDDDAESFGGGAGGGADGGEGEDGGPPDINAPPFALGVAVGSAKAEDLASAWASPEAAAVRSVLATLRACEMPALLSRVCGAEMLPDPHAAAVQAVSEAADAEVAATAPSPTAAAGGSGGGAEGEGGDGEDSGHGEGAEGAAGGGGKGGKKGKKGGKGGGKKGKGQKDRASVAVPSTAAARFAAACDDGKISFGATAFKTGGKVIGFLEGLKVLTCKEKKGVKHVTAIHPAAFDALEASLAPPAGLGSGGRAARRGGGPFTLSDKVSDAVVQACGGIVPVKGVAAVTASSRTTRQLLIPYLARRAVAAADGAGDGAVESAAVLAQNVQLPSTVLLGRKESREAIHAYVQDMGLVVARKASDEPSPSGGVKAKGAKGKSEVAQYVRVPFSGAACKLAGPAGLSKRKPEDEVVAKAASAAAVAGEAAGGEGGVGGAVAEDGSWQRSVWSAAVGAPVEFVTVPAAVAEGCEAAHVDAGGRVLCAVVKIGSLLASAASIFTKCVVVVFAGPAGQPIPPHPRVVKPPSDTTAVPLAAVAGVMCGVVQSTATLPVPAAQRMVDAVVSQLPERVGSGTCAFEVDGTLLSGRCAAVAVVKESAPRFVCHRVRGHDVVDVDNVNPTLISLDALATHLRKRLGGSAWVEDTTPRKVVRVQACKLDRVKSVVAEVLPLVEVGKKP